MWLGVLCVHAREKECQSVTAQVAQNNEKKTLKMNDTREEEDEKNERKTGTAE